MLNTQLNNAELNSTSTPTLWKITSWILEWSLWADSTYDKYSFIEIIDWVVKQTITLADFLTNWKIWLYVIDNNIRDTPVKDFTKFDNPFSDWGQILWERSTQKEITLTLWILTTSL